VNGPRPDGLRLVGPGSQPDEGPELEYLEMPQGMFTHELVHRPEPEELAAAPQARRILETVLAALEAGAHTEGRCMSLEGLENADHALLHGLLGEGEVAVNFEAPDRRLQAQETILTGVWWVREVDARGRPLHEALEVGAVPRCVRRESFSGDRRISFDPDAAPPGVQNGPALLAEIAEHLAARRAGDPVHVINLTLLPVTAEDLAYVGERLGVGPTTLLSRGYGNCRIGATAKEPVWWVKYFNSQEKLILNTIEIVEVPAVAQAAREDFEDSARRLAEILELTR